MCVRFTSAPLTANLVNRIEVKGNTVSFLSLLFFYYYYLFYLLTVLI